MKKIHSIQYIRAFAAILVLLFHAYSIIFRPAINIFSFGQYGVDIFFMISGLIMSYIMAGYAEKEKAHEDFFRKRLARIYPPYFLALIFALSLSAAGIGGFSKQKGIFDFTLFTFFDSFSQGKITGTQTHLPIAWTLYYEMFFYLVCTLSLLLKENYKSGIAIFFSVAFLVPDLLDFVHLDYRLFFLFFAGFYFGEVLTKRARWLDVVCLTISIHSVYLLYDNGLARALSITLSMLFIISFQRLNFKEIKAVSFLGDASYSIYLFHFSLCYLAKEWMPHNFQEIFFSLYVVGIISIACANYWFIEKRITNFLTRKNDK